MKINSKWTQTWPKILVGTSRHLAKERNQGLPYNRQGFHTHPKEQHTWLIQVWKELTLAEYSCNLRAFLATPIAQGIQGSFHQKDLRAKIQTTREKESCTLDQGKNMKLAHNIILERISMILLALNGSLMTLTNQGTPQACNPKTQHHLKYL